MGAITKPSPERNFNGTISIKQLSRQHVIQQRTHRYRFSLDYDVNQQIKDGEWRQLHEDATFTMGKLSRQIVEFFDLGDDVEDVLCFRYKNGQQQQYITMLGDDTIENKVITMQEGVQRPLTINNVELSILLEPGTIVEEEVNCNSAFMLRILPIIAAEIRNQLHWIPPEEQIYLIMDNAGRHGTQQARDQYTRQLQHEYNITIIQQSARSPEVNTLDLGVWMSVQSSVDKRHRNRRRDPDGLAETVQEAWNNLQEPTITRIFNRIPNSITTDCQQWRR